MLAHRRLLVVLAVAALVVAVPIACSDSDSGNNINKSTSTSSSGSNAGGGGGTGGMTGMGAGDTGGGFNPTNSGGNGQGGDENCLTTESEAETLPLHMLVVLDRSKSMADSKLWVPTVGAITQFVQDPASTGVGVAMTFFPVDMVQDTCSVGYYNPPHLAFGQLPAHAQLVVDAMTAQTPAGGDTPVYGALFGSYQFANQYQDMHKDDVVAVVFASDGVPNSCPTNPVDQNDVAEIAKLADAALAYNGVRTFAIAIKGANVADLDQIAAAGGTVAAMDVTKDINLFKTKLDEIRAKALGCEYGIPEPMGQEFDPKKVNVNYTPGGSNEAQKLPQAANEADCAGNDGWYYDDPVNPTTILLCPKTCEAVSKDGAAKISFVFGCPTVVN